MAFHLGAFDRGGQNQGASDRGAIDRGAIDRLPCFAGDRFKVRCFYKHP